jgi:hypothetical protein
MLMPEKVCVVWAGRLENLLNVIGRLPQLALEVMLSGNDMFLVRVIDLLAVVAFIIASSNYDSFGAPLWPPLTTLGAPLSALAGNLGRRPSVASWDCLAITLDENGSNYLLTSGVLGDDVK